MRRSLAPVLSTALVAITCACADVDNPAAQPVSVAAPPAAVVDRATTPLVVSSESAPDIAAFLARLNAEAERLHPSLRDQLDESRWAMCAFYFDPNNNPEALRPASDDRIPRKRR